MDDSSVSSRKVGANMPEPMRIGLANVHHTDAGRCYRIEIEDDNSILIAHAYGGGKAESIKRGRRIVACMNACVDIPTEDLESSPSITEYISDQACGAVEQRDELAAVLRACLPFIDDASDVAQFYPNSAVTKVCRDAVTKAKEVLAKLDTDSTKGSKR